VVLFFSVQCQLNEKKVLERDIIDIKEILNELIDNKNKVEHTLKVINKAIKSDNDQIFSNEIGLIFLSV
jgi:hypothetical protein